MENAKNRRKATEVGPPDGEEISLAFCTSNTMTRPCTLAKKRGIVVEEIFLSMLHPSFHLKAPFSTGMLQPSTTFVD